MKVNYFLEAKQTVPCWNLREEGKGEGSDWSVSVALKQTKSKKTHRRWDCVVDVPTATPLDELVSLPGCWWMRVKEMGGEEGEGWRRTEHNLGLSYLGPWHSSTS